MIGDALEAVAAAGLPTRHRLPDEPLSDAAWTALLGRVRTERLEGPLAWSVAEGALPASDAQRAEAAAAHATAMATVLVLERRLVELAGALDEHRVRWRLLKGSAIAHLDEPDPSLRSFGDVDLLVASEDLAVAHRLLADRSGRRHYPEPAPGYDARFGKGAAHTLPDGVEVDVHRTLALGPFGLAVDPEDLFAGTERLAIGSASIPALDRPRRFLHACYHAVLGQDPPRRVALRDVALTLPPEGGAARTAHCLARTWGGEAVVAAALADAVRLLALDLDHPLVPWALALRPTGRDRRWLAAHRGPNRSSAARTILAVEALPGARSKLAYARAVSRARGAPGRLAAFRPAGPPAP